MIIVLQETPQSGICVLIDDNLYLCTDCPYDNPTDELLYIFEGIRQGYAVKYQRVMYLEPQANKLAKRLLDDEL